MNYVENVEDRLSFKEPREFSELISVPFSYFFKNFKGIVFPMLKFAGPIILIGMIFLSFAVSSLIDQAGDALNQSFENQFWYYFNYTLISGILLGLGYVMAIGIIMSYAVLAEEKGKGNFSDEDVKSLAFSTYFNLLIAQLLKFGVVLIGIVPLVIAAILFANTLPGLLILVFFLFGLGAVYLFINLTFVDFVVIKERVGPIKAIKRSFEITKDNWWRTFGLLFIIQTIISFAMQILLIPIMFISGAMGFAGGGETELVVILIIVFTVFISVVSIIVYTIPNIAIVYLYYFIEETKDNPDLMNRISNISGNYRTKNSFKDKF